MGVHPVWRECRCGCGCGHKCRRRYGPYYIYSTAETSYYLGKLDKAIEKMSNMFGVPKELAKRILFEQGLRSAVKMKLRGYEPTPPWLVSEHIHHKRKKKRKREPSEVEIEFWKEVEKVLKKIEEEKNQSNA